MDKFVEEGHRVGRALWDILKSQLINDLIFPHIAKVKNPSMGILYQ